MTYDPMRLSEDTQGILDEVIGYHRHKLHEFEARRDRRTIAKTMDGDYHLIRLLTGLRENNARRSAPYEMAWSDRVAEKLNKQPQPGCAFLPVDLQAADRLDRRDLVAAVASAGGFTVSTETAPGNLFVGFLHNSSVFERMGISRVGLMGYASVPEIKTSISTYWLPAEGVSITPSQFEFLVSAATPKSIAAYAIASDLLLKQTSPTAQSFILREMARATAAEFDKQLLNGTGASGKPLGLLNTGNIASVSGTTLAYSGILDLIEDIEDASGIVEPDRFRPVIAPNAARLLRARATTASGSTMIMTANDLAGYPAQVTKSVPDSGLVFGDWSQAVVLEWGALQVGVDPYGADGGLFKKGQVGLRCIWDVDLVVLHRQSFGKITSIT